MAFRTPVDEWWCGTDPGAIDSLSLWRSSSSYRVSSECYVVRIAIHLLRRDGCGGNALTMSDIPTILSILAEHFEPHGIRFYLVSVDTICNTYYYNGWQSPWGVNEVNGAINLYLSGSDALSYGIGGIASGIPGKYLWVGGREDGTALSLSPVVSHEMGHCLGLFHTFHGLCELVAVVNLSMALTVVSAETMFAIPLLIQRHSRRILYIGGLGGHVSRMWIV